MNETPAICVVEPGFLTSVQDLGRPGWTAIGVPRGGAADTISLRVGNRLVGNDDGAAALEMTLIGGTYEFECDAITLVSGGAMDARIDGRAGSRPAPPWLPMEVRRGERLMIGPIRRGIRSYLCVAGGVSVPQMIGSRSTHLGAGFGGLGGRALRNGDTLPVGKNAGECRSGKSVERAARYCDLILARDTVRAVDGAHRESFATPTIEFFWNSTFEVSTHADRAALRLVGQLGQSTLVGRMPSEAMMHGAVQIPEAGTPIVLMVDHPTTGGYPVIACVAAVDHAVLAQLGSRRSIRFEHVSVPTARALYLEQERILDAEVLPR
jgi:antagonist of KipI